MKGRFRFMYTAVIGVLFMTVFCAGGAAQQAEVVETITNLDLKMDGVAWDGKNIWVITYQSSPLEWKIVKLDHDGSILSSFPVPVTSLDDIHNFGMTNITSDGKTIWANLWNEGMIYQFTKKGKIKKIFGVPSVNQLIPVGITLVDKYIYVLHWSDKHLYKLDTKGNELGKISLRKITPPPDMGLTWDGENFWAASKGANRIMRITPEGELTGFIKGPKKGGGIRDIEWDGEHMLLVYQQDNTIYKLKISD